MAEVARPVEFELVKNGLNAVVDEMAIVVVRTAYSSIIRDLLDFATAICDRDGKFVAQSVTTPLHLGTVCDAMENVLQAFGGSVRPGDVYILNDPYRGGSHLPDLYIFKPIFVGGEVFAYSVVIAHHADMGGRVAGGIAVDSTELFQEGLRIPPSRLYARGTPNYDLLGILEANVRLPSMVRGDLRAQLSACELAEREVQRLVRRYGERPLQAYLSELLDYSERLARAEIAAMPDGTYHFVDFLDDDSVSDEPIRIEVALTITGTDVEVDLAGTSPQVATALNSPLANTRSVVYATLRAVMPPSLPNNAGYLRPIHVSVPSGTIANPVPPAPVGSRGATAYRVADAVFGALAQAIPERVFAAGEGGNTSIRFALRDADRGYTVLADVIGGTWGARPDRDGVDGVANISSNIANCPAEILEAEHPVRIDWYGLEPDTGGAGKYRGGLSIRREYRILTGDCLVSLRSDRCKFLPFGLQGGQSGTPSLTMLNRGSAEEQMLPAKFTRRLKQGDRLLHIQASGGGCGDPLDRDPEAVARDCRDGKLSPARAQRDYGVVVDPDRWQVDWSRTAALRAGLREQPEAQLEVT